MLSKFLCIIATSRTCTIDSILQSRSWLLACGRQTGIFRSTWHPKIAYKRGHPIPQLLSTSTTMKLSLLSTAALAASAFAAPSAAPADVSAVTEQGPLTLNRLANDDEVWGTIDCDPTTKICKVDCRLEGVDIACQLVGIFNSVFYGIEQLAGFTVRCTEGGCQAICPVDGTLVCTANEVVATFNSAWTLGESVVLGGVTWVLDSIGDLFGW
uniref:ARAD1A01364p n=1 Tax=Blastobotrys adeninivorans TaxID=409370 RepID=A0A060T2F2_BLAAD